MITIRKYGNRRLYDSSASRYVNLEELARLIRDGEQIKVVDARTGEDLTQATLLQIISEVHGGGLSLPAGFLHRLIRYGGDAPWSRVLMQQFSLGLEMLDAQLAQLEQRFPPPPGAGTRARGDDRAEPPPDLGAERGPDRGPDRGHDRGHDPADRGADAAERGQDRGADRGHDRGPDRGPDPAEARRAEPPQPELSAMRERLQALERRLKR